MGTQEGSQRWQLRVLCGRLAQVSYLHMTLSTRTEQGVDHTAVACLKVFPQPQTARKQSIFHKLLSTEISGVAKIYCTGRKRAVRWRQLLTRPKSHSSQANTSTNTGWREFPQGFTCQTGHGLHTVEWVHSWVGGAPGLFKYDMDNSRNAGDLLPWRRSFSPLLWGRNSNKRENWN